MVPELFHQTHLAIPTVSHCRMVSSGIPIIQQRYVASVRRWTAVPTNFATMLQLLLETTPPLHELYFERKPYFFASRDVQPNARGSLAPLGIFFGHYGLGGVCGISCPHLQAGEDQRRKGSDGSATLMSY